MRYSTGKIIEEHHVLCMYIVHPSDCFQRPNLNFYFWTIVDRASKNISSLASLGTDPCSLNDATDRGSGLGGPIRVK